MAAASIRRNAAKSRRSLRAREGRRLPSRKSLDELVKKCLGRSARGFFDGSETPWRAASSTTVAGLKSNPQVNVQLSALAGQREDLVVRRIQSVGAYWAEVVAARVDPRRPSNTTDVGGGIGKAAAGYQGRWQIYNLSNTLYRIIREASRARRF